MDRSTLLAHLRRTHFAPGDGRRALEDAHAIADFLKREYSARVIGIGSLFEPDRRFRDTSDIDLVVEGLPAERFFEATAKAASMTDFELDVIPFEDANDYMQEAARTKGVEL
jgi:predicted nucleotidyltransferase